MPWLYEFQSNQNFFAGRASAPSGTGRIWKKNSLNCLLGKAEPLSLPSSNWRILPKQHTHPLGICSLTLRQKKHSQFPTFGLSPQPRRTTERKPAGNDLYDAAANLLVAGNPDRAGGRPSPFCQQRQAERPT